MATADFVHSLAVACIVGAENNAETQRPWVSQSPQGRMFPPTHFCSPGCFSPRVWNCFLIPLVRFSVQDFHWACQPSRRRAFILEMRCVRGEGSIIRGAMYHQPPTPLPTVEVVRCLFFTRSGSGERHYCLADVMCEVHFPRSFEETCMSSFQATPQTKFVAPQY